MAATCALNRLGGADLALDDLIGDAGRRLLYAQAPRLETIHNALRQSPAMRDRRSRGQPHVHAAPCGQAPPERSVSRIGNWRMRLPLAAKIALGTAGDTGAAPGSPTPPHLLPPLSTPSGFELLPNWDSVSLCRSCAVHTFAGRRPLL